MFSKLIGLVVVVGLSVGLMASVPVQAAPFGTALCLSDAKGGPILVSADPNLAAATVSAGTRGAVIGRFFLSANAALGNDYSIFTMTTRINGNQNVLLNPKLVYSRYPVTTSAAWLWAKGYGYENADGSWAAQDLRIDLKQCDVVAVTVYADIAPLGWNGVSEGETVQVELIADADHGFATHVRGSSERLYGGEDVNFDVVGPVLTLGN